MLSMPRFTRAPFGDDPVPETDSNQLLPERPSTQTLPDSLPPAAAESPATAESHGTLQWDAEAVAPQPVAETVPGAPPGPTIPGYEIVGVLGRGGMGIVYRARHLALKRTVAIKMILAGGHASEQERTRFRSEAEAVARLQHSGIVQLFEVGERDGMPFGVLEFVDGGSLSAKLAAGPLPPREAARLLEKMADAVHLAHGHNIVHRDLKPANVLLTAEGDPKITDFGLAKLVDSDSALTQSGAVLGTPSYMAPEQASGLANAVGPPADIYALGAVLYECLTGNPPFRGDSVVETLDLVRTREAKLPPEALRKVPRDLQTICLKCLRKPPERRYASAKELGDDLRRFLAGEPILARPVPALERAAMWVRRRPALAALFGVLILGALVLVALASAFHLRLRQSFAQTQALNVRLKVLTGSRLAEEGDLLLALPWFLSALESDADPTRAEAHRIRLGTALRRCPRLAQLWFHEARVTRVAFNTDGSRVLTASADRTAFVRDTATGAVVAGPFSHDDVVLDAAFRPDGAAVVTACADGTARVWAVADGRCLAGPLRHPGPVRSVAYSPDGRRLLTVANDDRARLWLLDRESPECTSLHHAERVRSAVFHPTDANRVLTGSSDGTAQVWSVTDLVPVGPPLKHPGEVVRAEFSPDGKTVLTLCSKGMAYLWDPDAPKPKPRELEDGHSGPILCAAFSPDGRLVATGSADNTARVWAVADARTITPPLPHGSDVLSVVFRADGKYLATASDDHMARVWEVSSTRSTPVVVPLHHNGIVSQVAFHPNGLMLLTASNDGTARIWVQTHDRLQIREWRHDDRVTEASFSSDGARVVTSCADGKATVWDVGDGRQVNAAVIRHDDEVAAAEFSPDGAWVATAGADGRARVWDVATGRPVTPWLEHPAAVDDVHFSPDGSRVITASKSGLAAVWDARTGERRGAFTHAGAVASARFSPDGLRVVSASADRTARVWDAATGELLLPHPFEHCEEVNDADFSPHGHRIVTAGGDGLARLWDAETGEPVGNAIRHGSNVTHASFSPDGLWVVTASNENTARVWNAATGEPHAPPLRHLGTVVQAAIGLRNRRVLTASGDNTARVWDLHTGEPLTPPLPHFVSLTWAEFSPDGNYVVTASADHTARLWDIRPDARPAEELKLVCRLLAGGRIDDTGGFVSFTREELHDLWEQFRRLPPEIANSPPPAPISEPRP
jgi:WD40 repeat protein